MEDKRNSINQANITPAVHSTPLSLGEGIGGEAVVVVRLHSYYTIAPFPNPGLLLRLKSVNSGA